MMKNILYASITLLISFVIFEFLNRVFDPLGIFYVREIETLMSDKLIDSTCDYMLPKNKTYNFKYFSVRLNNYGMRGPNISKKNKFKKRILFLGDSVVFGWGVEEDSTFVGRFRQYYQQRDTIVEVSCAAVPSWNTFSEYNFLNKHISNYDPDIIILLIVQNDMLAHRDQIKSDNYLSKLKSYVVYTSNILLTLRYMYYSRQVSTHEEQTADNVTIKNEVKNKIIETIELCKKNTVPLIFVLNGSEEYVMKNKPLYYYSNILKNLSQEYVVLPNSLMDNKYHNSYCDPHYNSEGNKIIYDQLLPILKSRF